MPRKIEPYTFQRAVEEWSRPPIDEVGYISSARLLDAPDDELRIMIERFEEARYAGWRNVYDLWRKKLGLDSTEGKVVLDFGCGVGIEALQFAKAGNRVFVADIAPDNLILADRVLKLFGCPAAGVLPVTEGEPFFEIDEPIDVFYANGVLHHTPKIREILKRAAEILTDEGEARLMLYSDRGFKWATGQKPEGIERACDHPRFYQFVRKFDGVGHYADWYSAEKLASVVDGIFELSSFDYITEKNGFFGQYAVAILKKEKGK